ncbi:hypothetical protein LV84_03251 [Algoriphagus ratkowskyi]|uniref:Uncharacterized protein n=2 Tax=Algoriphagus ratkowskyi TaxID=57028 RepID=A0A2W7RCZ0_9BACT|nr:hypothetical protein [Algoriphagus ratkowskyi]PZX53527.1 hypothetical protein LV84_03251 [Algoriphagus ratkowskyi]TXD76447.1 hypothetical protein ESW18_15660 [Algoriphagus ratkowskyi]
MVCITYQIGYDFGYGSEKALEIAVTRGVYTGSGVGIGSLRMLSNTSMRGTTLFKAGKNFRIDLDMRNGLHYQRRGPGGIGRHRQWQVKPGDQGVFGKDFNKTIMNQFIVELRSLLQKTLGWSEEFRNGNRDYSFDVDDDIYQLSNKYNKDFKKGDLNLLYNLLDFYSVSTRATASLFRLIFY